MATYFLDRADLPRIHEIPEGADVRSEVLVVQFERPDRFAIGDTLYVSHPEGKILTMYRFVERQPVVPTTDTSNQIGAEIRSLEMTIRATNCLLAERIYTLSELTSRSETELLRLPQLTRKVLNEIRETLESRGLSLRK